MPKLRKIIINKQVHFVTLSVEEGIMLPCNPLAIFLTKAALLRAHKHHPIEINHFIVNGTHIHMLVTISNPEDLPKFMERFKTELAHYLNRILGRRKRTVWCKSYDSPALLTPNDVIEKIVYLYTNPVKDGLIQSINKYPGLSSWDNFNNKNYKISSPIISRDSLVKVDQNNNFYGFKKIRDLFAKAALSIALLEINPDGWMHCFDIPLNKDDINQQIFKLIENTEKQINAQTDKFMGRSRLENQGIELGYIPNRKVGKRMWCISSNIDLRKAYINFAKNLCNQAREIYFRLRAGDTTAKYPPGVFAAPLPLLANILSVRL